MYLVVSCSLNPVSRSRVLAEAAFELLQDRGREAALLDLRETPLPLCDGEARYGLDEVRQASRIIREAEGILVSTPIYNYDVNSVAKNLIELTGQAWHDKVVGFLCAAGGRSSYMGVMSLANSLMLDFRCIILPRFVYVTDESFLNGGLDPKVASRLAAVVDELIRVATALKREEET